MNLSGLGLYPFEFYSQILRIRSLSMMNLICLQEESGSSRWRYAAIWAFFPLLNTVIEKFIRLRVGIETNTKDEITEYVLPGTSRR